MTDRELMELAARAAGLDVHRGEKWQSDMLFRAVPRPSSPLVANVEWNPLADDGDALRLAVKLRLDVLHNEPQDNDAWVMAGGHMDHTENVDGEDYRLAATRRAITRAAAALAGTAPGATGETL